MQATSPQQKDKVQTINLSAGIYPLTPNRTKFSLHHIYNEISISASWKWKFPKTMEGRLDPTGVILVEQSNSRLHQRDPVITLSGGPDRKWWLAEGIPVIWGPASINENSKKTAHWLCVFAINCAVWRAKNAGKSRSACSSFAIGYIGVESIKRTRQMFN